MKNTLLNFLNKELFLTGPIALIISPVYIIRNGLYKAILKFAFFLVVTS